MGNKKKGTFANLLDTFMDRTSAYIKLVAEHGIARISVASGLVIVFYALAKFTEKDWTFIAVFVISGIAMIATGGFVRWAEMRYKLFSGRAFTAKCASCGKPLRIKVPGNVELKPPMTIDCENENCRAINFIQ
jgi:hypothetical protein